MKRAKVGERRVVVDTADHEEGSSTKEIHPRKSARGSKSERPSRKARRAYAEAANPNAMKAAWKAEKKSKRKAAKTITNPPTASLRKTIGANSLNKLLKHSPPINSRTPSTPRTPRAPIL